MKIKDSFKLLLKAPATLILHIAICMIAAGAFTTHFYGIQGSVTLSDNGTPTNRYKADDNVGSGIFPFTVALLSTEVSYYPHTTTPSDYSSHIKITFPDGQTESGTVSMNRIFSSHGWRFYQTAIGPDSSTLSVAHDPAGIALTYTGYIMATIAMLLYLLSPRTSWRTSLKRFSLPLTLLCTAFSANAAPDTATPETISGPLAREMGKLLVFHEGRVRALSAFAIEFTRGICGKESYRGLSPEQVLAGWLFYYDSWKHESMIKVDGAELKSLLNAPDGKAPLTAFFSKKGYLLEPLLANRTNRKAIDADARIALISSVATGAAFCMFPYRSLTGHTEWLSWGSQRPTGIDPQQWDIVSESLPQINKFISNGKNVAADSVFKRIAGFQIEFLHNEGGDITGIMHRVEAERFYMKNTRLFPVAIFLVIVGLSGIVLAGNASTRLSKTLSCIINITAAAGSIYILTLMGLRWYITDHIPLAGGHETMLAMSAVALFGATVARRKWNMVKSPLLLVGGLALLVASIGGDTPQLGALQPVLASPWLSVHVLLMMIAYTLAALMTLLSSISIIANRKNNDRQTATVNAIILPITVFLLAAGIMTGAVWANQSWGRYWGWDSKETCAFATMLIYALPLHSRSLAAFRRPKTFNIYIALAFLAILFTYFGANYLLPGLHSYA